MLEKIFVLLAANLLNVQNVNSLASIDGYVFEEFFKYLEPLLKMFFSSFLIFIVVLVARELSVYQFLRENVLRNNQNLFNFFVRLTFPHYKPGEIS